MKKIILILTVILLSYSVIAATGETTYMVYSDGTTTINATDVCLADGTCMSATSGGNYTLKVGSDSGTGIITNAETFNLTGGSGISTAMSGNTLTISASVAAGDTNCSVEGSCPLVTYDTELQTTADSIVTNISWHTSLYDHTNVTAGKNITITGGVVSIADSLLTAFKLLFYVQADVDSAIATVGTSIDNNITSANTSMKGYVDTNFLDLAQTSWFYDGWVVYDSSTYNFSFNTSKLSTSYFGVSSYAVIAGTVSGNINNITHNDGAYDSKTMNITEAVGSPALDIRMNFTGISDFNEGIMRYYTSALAGAYPIIYLWDYDDSDWEEYSPIGESSSFAIIEQSIFDSDSHIQNDIVQMRIYKPTNGNTINIYYIDWIALASGFGTPSGTETDPFSIHTDALNYSYFNYTNGVLQWVGSITDTTINNCSVQGSCGLVCYDTELSSNITSIRSELQNNINTNITALETSINTNINNNYTALSSADSLIRTSIDINFTLARNELDNSTVVRTNVNNTVTGTFTAPQYSVNNACRIYGNGTPCLIQVCGTTELIVCA